MRNLLQEQEWDNLEKQRDDNSARIYLTWALILSGCLFFWLLLTVLVVKGCSADETLNYSYDEYCDAIWHAEGGKKAKKPYGILSVRCDNEKECRQICINTVRNNVGRYKKYGHKSYRNYLDFLASRYAPIGAENDVFNLNRHWIRNVKWFLENPKAVRL